MKSLIVIAAIFASSIASAAIQDTMSRTCQENRALVKRNGVLVMTTNGGKQTRYVADGSWCFGDQNAEQAWVATASGRHCPMAFVCVDKPSDNN